MVDKVKEVLAALSQVFSVIKARIVEVLVLVVGALVFYVTLKNKEIASLKATVSLLNTQKDADALQNHINDKLQDASLLQKQVDGYNETLKMIEARRASLTEGARTVDPVTYWKNN